MLYLYLRLGQLPDIAKEILLKAGSVQRCPARFSQLFNTDAPQPCQRMTGVGDDARIMVAENVDGQVLGRRTLASNPKAKSVVPERT
jgi:hypothetical protein